MFYEPQDSTTFFTIVNISTISQLQSQDSTGSSKFTEI